MDTPDEFVQNVCEDVKKVASQTVEFFGAERADQLSISALDSFLIQSQIDVYYSMELRSNLVYASLLALMKELKWLQFLFLAGNYPLVKGRLRYLWEATFRAFYAETSDNPEVAAMDAGQKLEWADKQRLTWDTCIKKVLVKVFPLAGGENEVMETYRGLWKNLNSYVHPSEYVQTRMLGESALLVRDHFDPEWANDTLHVAANVVDLIFFAVLRFHVGAITETLFVLRERPYVLVDLLLRARETEEPNAA